MVEVEVYRTVPEYLEEDFNNILYVDDEESNLRVFDSVFSRYYNVYTANNGQTAIEMLRENKIHMIITDQKMPEMTGTDLLESILEEFPDMIRIILTGFADIQAIIKAINKCSIYKYVTKPYENAEMREIIDKGLEIYNMREAKYKSDTGDDHKKPAFADIDEASLFPLMKKVSSDLLVSDNEFEYYFDFHINYRMEQEGFSCIYSDFVINTDEESNMLFFVSFKVPQDQKGALVQMHLKSKLRKILERDGNAVNLTDLTEELSSDYIDSFEDSAPHDFKVLTYNWNSGDFQYLSKEKLIKPFEVGDQLLPLKLKEKKAKNGYKLFSAKTENELVIYFWDFKLSNTGNETESPNYFKQIIDNVTSMPFDLQGEQVAKGVNSVREHFDDAILYALYLNE